MRPHGMTCQVRIARPLRSYTAGVAVLTARGRTLAEVVADLERRCPGIRFRMIDAQDRIRPHMRLFVNSGEARELSAPVQAGDTVHVVCALSARLQP